MAGASLAPHLRGFDGGVGDPPADPVDDYAGDVIDLLDALHVHDAVVGGLSMGGYVAFALLRHAAVATCEALILADTRSQADTPEGVEARQRMLQLATDKGGGRRGRRDAPEAARRDDAGERGRNSSSACARWCSRTAGAGLAGAIRAMMTRPDSTSLLSTIHVPALDHRRRRGHADAACRSPRRCTAALPDPSWSGSPGAGHLSSLERPDAFNDALARFLMHRV